MEKNRIMLDTSAYSAFMKGHINIKYSLQKAYKIHVNSIIIGELLYGFINGKKERENRLILQDFLSSPRVQIIDIDEETSERYAVIKNYLTMEGTPLPVNDIWISASAMQYGLKVLTTDKHYLKIPQIVVEYYEI